MLFVQGDYAGQGRRIVPERMHESVNVWAFTGNNYNNTVTTVGYMADQVKPVGKPVNARAKADALDYAVDLYFCCRSAHRLDVSERKIPGVILFV